MNDSPLRIAYVIDDLSVGGAQKQLAGLTAAFGGNVRAVVCCISHNSEPYATVMRGQGTDVVVQQRLCRWDPMLPLALARTLRSRRIDVVHGWLDAANVYAYAAARSIGAPVVLSMQSDRLMLSGVRAKVLARMLRRADAVTVNSGAGYSFLTRTIGVEKSRAVLVPNWVSPQPAAPPRQEGPAVIGFVGRLVDIKRADRLIDAFALIRRGGKDALLTIVGDGPDRGELERRVEHAGVAEAVTFRGVVEDVVAELARFDCIAIPSEFEGLPNVALEAFAAGLPVVSLPVGDLGELVRDGETGRLVEGKQPEDLAEAILAVLEDAALQNTARAAGPALVRDRFSVARAIDTLLSLYAGMKKEGR